MPTETDGGEPPASRREISSTRLVFLLWNISLGVAKVDVLSLGEMDQAAGRHHPSGVGALLLGRCSFGCGWQMLPGPSHFKNMDFRLLSTS